MDEIDFPIGMRPWKVNTILSLDGFRICITGNASGGKCLIAQPIMQFSSDEYWKYYLKKVEKFVEKVKNNSSYVYDVDYDAVKDIASAITPVPGGVGSVTTTMMLEAVYEAYHA